MKFIFFIISFHLFTYIYLLVPLILFNFRTGQYHNERKYIVFESSLLELFQWCPACSGPSKGAIAEELGTFLKIIQRCQDPDCKHNREWTNQKFIRTMPVGNLLLSSAIIMSGTYDISVIFNIYILTYFKTQIIIMLF